MGSCCSKTDNGDSNANNPSPTSKHNNRENHGKSAKKYEHAPPQDVRDHGHGKKDNKPYHHHSRDIQRHTDEKNVMENKDRRHGKRKEVKNKRRQSKDHLSGEIQRLTNVQNDMENHYKRELQDKTSETAQLQERLKNIQQDNYRREKEREEIYKKELQSKSNQISQIKEQMKNIEKDQHEKEKERRKRYQMTLDSLEVKNDSLRNELERTKQEKNDLLTRFSALAANKLTDGNANIADLSDENRPTKLSEKYSELYDNQWTDAFTYLSSIKERGEEELCSILVNAFCVIYLTCRKKADADLKAFISAIDELYESADLAREMIKTAKDRRKKRPRMKVGEIKQLYTSEMQQVIPSEEQKGIESFLDKSIELCWLMAIQDPPLYVDTNLSLRGKPFETNLFKPYTVQGKYVDFIVWPALYLHEGGSLLNKGVAQGKKQKHETQSQLFDYVENLRSQVNRLSLTPKSSSKPDTKYTNYTVNERVATKYLQPESDTNGIHTETSAGNAASIIKPAKGEPKNEKSASDNTNPASDSTKKLTEASAESVLQRMETSTSSETHAPKSKQTGMSARRVSSFTNIKSNAVQEKQDSESSTMSSQKLMAKSNYESGRKSSSFSTDDKSDRMKLSEWQSHQQSGSKQQPAGKYKSVTVNNSKM
ncbi:uncharacterized protein LOC132725704 [Ruditapes philippinarum]|uniref:uncharacterized protein LOC132725704 n=1 Tax=Ruditapes philippinarum TaxID=129788 RepID=UPI00295AE278|nr:uncharacterized protein LOC132725704 [Ruditapes philippinarum]XP_060566868.1 uncharacterized protein LOC132725704 [Ruditapes philippinarum]XP_060566869.1 uncharacterized protein LOC132725704 [Ruditapes philippinarum]